MLRIPLCVLVAAGTRSAATLQLAVEARTALRAIHIAKREPNGLADMIPLVALTTARIFERHCPCELLGVVRAQEPALSRTFISMLLLHSARQMTSVAWSWHEHAFFIEQ